MQAADRLPEFRKPPINEVVLGVQFDALTAMTSAHFGLYWSTVRHRYPNISEHAQLAANFEVFGNQSLQPFGAQQMKIETFMKPPLPRYWMEDNDGGRELLQLQQDRLLHNWRRKTDTDEYPRYGHVRKRLQEDFDSFSSFVGDEKLGKIEINQCEATYINLITLDPDRDPHKEIDSVIAVANAWPEGNDLPVIENTLIQSRAVLRVKEEPVARLYMNLQPVIMISDNAPAIRLELTVRGKPKGPSMDDALALLDFAHEGIVKTFTAVTTRAMHKGWGRLDVN